MSNKSKMGGCKKKQRAHKASKGERRNIAIKTGNDHLYLLNAHRSQGK